MSALATARRIEDLGSVQYPEGIRSPSTKLNANAQDGKFRYDRDFLLQFMKICTAKPDTLPPLNTLGLQLSDQSSYSMARGSPGRHKQSSGAVPASRQASTGLNFNQPSGFNRASPVNTFTGNPGPGPSPDSSIPPPTTFNNPDNRQPVRLESEDAKKKRIAEEEKQRKAKEAEQAKQEAEETAKREEKRKKKEKKELKEKKKKERKEKKDEERRKKEEELQKLEEEKIRNEQEERERKQKEDKEEGGGRLQLEEAERVRKLEEAERKRKDSGRKRPSPFNSTIAKGVPTSMSTLAAAHRIEDLRSFQYPDGISSPSIELNANAQDSKFKYDREFLLQFMKICTKKPDTLPPLDALGLQPSDQSSYLITRGGSGRHRQSSSAVPASRQASTGLNFNQPSGIASQGSEQATNED